MSVENVENYILRSVDIDRDDEKLAEMWNASDDQWPGTWTEGVPMTAQLVRDEHERGNYIDEMIWDTGDAIAGYCSLSKNLEEENVTYVALLNVAPEYQNKSLARKFLTHCVERTIGLDSVRLDLETWSGNLKAVPLYKKCGFFWIPDTAVFMLNFMPAILAMPSTKSFFKEHDWYRSFKRELTQEEDDERWEGMKVFTYRFEEDDDRLTVWADKESRTITAVETDDFFAAAIADEIEPPRGLSTTIRWKLTNKRDRSVAVSLIANGDEKLKINHRESIEIAAGESVTLAASVEVVSDTPEVKKGKPVPHLKSVLVVDGMIVELATGLRPRTGVEVSTHPGHITLLPGVERTVRVQLRSRLKKNVEARLSIAPEKGLTSDWTQKTTSLGAEGYEGIPITLKADSDGAFEFPVSIDLDLDGETVHLPAKKLSVFALAMGGILAAKVEDSIRVENETFRLLIEKEGGRININDRASGKWLCSQSGYAVPPTWPSEYDDGLFDLSLEHDREGVVVVASMASKDNPGFVLRKRVKVGAGSTFSIEYDFENLGTESRRFQLNQFVGSIREDASLTLPLASGLTKGVGANFPGPSDDVFKKPETYAERWAAIEKRDATVGVMWGDDAEEIEWGWKLNLLTRFYECPPQSQIQTKPLYIYVGEGGWHTVQKIWKRLVCQNVSTDDRLPQHYAPLSARIEPPLAIASDGKVGVRLTVENRISRKWSGKATIALPEDWGADTGEFDLKDVYWQRPFRADIQLSTKAPPGVGSGRIEIRSTEFDGDFELPLIRLGDGSSVGVDESECEGQRILRVDNGRVSLDVTPGFNATVSALREGDVNHLASRFPNAEALGWISPWYGGLSPVLTLPGKWWADSKLYKETFEAEQVSCRDGQDIEWKGVRQRARLENEDMRGLTLELDTLTVGGSPLFKGVMRLINETGIVRRLQSGWVSFLQPDGSRARTTVFGPEHQFKHTERIFWVEFGHWGAAQNPDTGRALALISPTPKVMMSGWGADGGHLALLTSIEVPAHDSIELVGYFVIADDIESVRHYAALKDLT